MKLSDLPCCHDKAIWFDNTLSSQATSSVERRRCMAPACSAPNVVADSDKTFFSMRQKNAELHDSPCLAATHYQTSGMTLVNEVKK